MLGRQMRTDTEINTARYSVELSKRHLAEQEGCIRRQRELVADLELSDPDNLVPEARERLRQMLERHEQMISDYASAQQRLRELGRSETKELAI